IVLLGRTGTGRSSSGNTILGRSAFWVDTSPCSVTAQCKRQTGTVNERSISVIDTPGFFHTGLPPQEVMAEVGRCVVLSSPGPHAFVVTLRPGRFTPEERDGLEWIKATFGPGATRFVVVLFTWGDQLQGKRIKDFLEESQELLEFVSSCHGGYHVFDNSEQKKAEDREEQGPELERRRRREEEQRKREEEEARKRAERLFWCELLTALGKGAAEGAGIMEKDKGKGKAVKKVKVVEKAAALAATPLSITSAAKAVGGAVREGGKVLYKHRKTFLH
uniref:AIG1-type G domain-containing protein n=1 Tax=Seriola dumerili TaxID=41447 RepID=A0A3B4UY82_SERDU